MVGKQFNRLRVVRLSERTKSGIYWECLCSCGNTTFVATSKLTSGKTKSCGCLASEILAKRNFIHGHTTGGKFTPEYHSWASMITRCYNAASKGYKTHGAKGVTVCKKWRDSFESFLSDMGARPPGHSLDRKNNKGNYTSRNCQWATGVVQARNRSSTIRATVDGVTRPLMEWCDLYRVKRARLRSMVEKRGMTYGRAIKTVIQCKHSKK